MSMNGEKRLCLLGLGPKGLCRILRMRILTPLPLSYASVQQAPLSRQKEARLTTHVDARQEMLSLPACYTLECCHSNAPFTFGKEGVTFMYREAI